MILLRALRSPAESWAVLAVKVVGAKRLVFFASSGSPAALLPARFCMAEILLMKSVIASIKTIKIRISNLRKNSSFQRLGSNDQTTGPKDRKLIARPSGRG